MKATLVFASICLKVFIEGSTQTPNMIDNSKWLIGTWENKTGMGVMYENWERHSSTELIGSSFMVEDQDTVELETLRLVQENTDLFYIPTVNNQNNQLPVKFRMVLFTDSVLRFENKGHDFPQIIEYRLINNDSLVAEISGNKDGQLKGSRFPMKRVRN